MAFSGTPFSIQTNNFPLSSYKYSQSQIAVFQENARKLINYCVRMDLSEDQTYKILLGDNPKDLPIIDIIKKNEITDPCQRIMFRGLFQCEQLGKSFHSIYVREKNAYDTERHSDPFKHENKLEKVEALARAKLKEGFTSKTTYEKFLSQFEGMFSSNVILVPGTSTQDQINLQFTIYQEVLNNHQYTFMQAFLLTPFKQYETFIDFIFRVAQLKCSHEFKQDNSELNTTLLKTKLLAVPFPRPPGQPKPPMFDFKYSQFSHSVQLFKFRSKPVTPQCNLVLAFMTRTITQLKNRHLKESLEKAALKALKVDFLFGLDPELSREEAAKLRNSLAFNTFTQNKQILIRAFENSVAPTLQAFVNVYFARALKKACFAQKSTEELKPAALRRT